MGSVWGFARGAGFGSGVVGRGGGAPLQGAVGSVVVVLGDEDVDQCLEVGLGGWGWALPGDSGFQGFVGSVRLCLGFAGGCRGRSSVARRGGRVRSRRRCGRAHAFGSVYVLGQFIRFVRSTKTGHAIAYHLWYYTDRLARWAIGQLARYGYTSIGYTISWLANGLASRLWGATLG